MQAYENRLSTFFCGKRTLWPHEGYTATPELLAAAGFYYKPTSPGSDNVVCFLCNKELEGWSLGDHPSTEHARNVPLCPWVLVKCLGRDDYGLAVEPELSMVRNAVMEKEWNYSERDDVEMGLPPRSMTMETARLKTFGDWWPHEGKRGWLVKAPKLAKAGFYYAPSIDAEDTAVCGLCQLGLDRWEPRDSPVNEHRNRRPNCPFFQNPKKTAAKSAPSKSTRSTRMSTRRSSAASAASAMVEDDDAMSVIIDTEAAVETLPDSDRMAISELEREETGLDEHAVRSSEQEPSTPAKRGRRTKNATTSSRRTGRQISKDKESKASVEAEQSDDDTKTSNGARKRSRSGDVNADPPKKRAASTKAKEKITALLDEHNTPQKKSSTDIKSASKEPSVLSDPMDAKRLPEHDVPLAKRNAKSKATTRTGRITRSVKTQPSLASDQMDADVPEKNATASSLVGASGKDDEVTSNTLSDPSKQEGEGIQIASKGGSEDKLEAKSKKPNVGQSRRGARKVHVSEPAEPTERADTIQKSNVLVDMAEMNSRTASPAYSSEISQRESCVPVQNVTTDADNTGISLPVEDEPEAMPVRKSRRVLKSRAETTKKSRTARTNADGVQKPLPPTTTTNVPSTSSQSEETQKAERDVARTEDMDAVMTVDGSDVVQDENLTSTSSENEERQKAGRDVARSEKTDALTTVDGSIVTEDENVPSTSSQNEETKKAERDVARSEENDVVPTVEASEVPQDENVPPISETRPSAKAAPQRRDLGRESGGSSMRKPGPLTTADVPNLSIPTHEEAVADPKEKSLRALIATKIVTAVVVDVPQTPSNPSSQTYKDSRPEASSESEEDSESSDEDDEEEEEEEDEKEEENPRPALSDRDLSARYGVSEVELDLTVEEYMKSILRAQVDRLQYEGEKMVKKLLDEAARGVFGSRIKDGSPIVKEIL